MRWVVLTLLVLLASGCAAPAATNVPTGPDAALKAYEATHWAERALGKLDPKHDHNDVTQHENLSTPNFIETGYDPLELSSGHTAGGYYCGEAAQTKEGKRLAVVNGFTGEVTFVLADVTDPAKPQKLAEYHLESPGTEEHPYDVAMTRDGKHVIVSVNPQQKPAKPPGAEGDVALPAIIPLQLHVRDACTGVDRAAGPLETVPYGPGLVMVGIQDPRNPVFEDYASLPFLAAHSISTGDVDNTAWVIASVVNLVHQGSYFDFYNIMDTPAGPKLSLVTRYQAPPGVDANAAPPLVNGHVDANIMKHPVTKKTVAYLADWDAGLIILDMSNPRLPTVISQFTRFDGKVAGAYLTGDETGNLHEALPIEGLWDGKHYVVAGQEILGHPKDHPTGWVYILDDTDPAKVSLVGKWTLPIDVEWKKGLQFSTHYLGILNRTMFVTNYHGGLWAADLSTPEKLADPPTVGVYLPAHAPPHRSLRPEPEQVGSPTVLDVLTFPDGQLVVYDGPSGVYSVHYDESKAMPPPPTWANHV